MTITEVDKQPVLRFTESEEPWDEHSLEALAAQPISYGVVQTGDHIEDGIPCVRVVDLTSDAVDPNAMIRTSDAISNSYRRTVLEKDDIMMALRGEIGLVRSVPDELVGANLTRGVARIVAKKMLVDPQFLLWSLQSPAVITDIGQKVNGSALKEIPIGGLREVVLSIPRSKTEQQKIAAFLGAVDRKIQQLKRKQELLEQYKTGVVQQLFSQELRFKRQDGGEFPEWEEKRLGDILTIGSGRDYKHLGKGDVPVFGTGGYMLSVDEALYDGETVFIGRKGTIDKPFYFKGKFWTVDTLFYTHQYRGVIPQFVLALFQRINWREHNEASGVPSLSKATIEKITVELPSLEEQSRIAGFLMALDAKVAGVAQAVAAAQKWKKGLLQQMFV